MAYGQRGVQTLGRVQQTILGASDDDVRGESSKGGATRSTDCVDARHRSMEMTAQEIYNMLDAAGVDFEVVEIFEGARVISFRVDDEDKSTEGESK